MTYEVYRYLFLGALIACGILAALSVALFFLLKIPQVIGDLTGRTARKAIENIRKQNEQTGDKMYKSSAVNLQRGKLTEKISQSGRIIPRAETPFGTGIITEQLSGQQNISYGDETTVLGTASETTVLCPQAGETTVLDAPAEEPPYVETVSYGEEPAYVEEPFQAFVIEYEITFIHTNEVIA